jgi:outer membrane immunogenic protein
LPANSGNIAARRQPDGLLYPTQPYGGGLEWAWTNNLFVKAEYLRVDFGSITSGPSPVFILGAPSGSTFTHSASLNVDIVRFGIDYKFW